MILELNWNQRLGHKTTKLNICHHMLRSSTRLQNRSSHVVERTRMSKDEKCTCKACKNTVFHWEICKFVGFLLPLSSWLLKLLNRELKHRGHRDFRFRPFLDRICTKKTSDFRFWRLLRFPVSVLSRLGFRLLAKIK